MATRNLENLWAAKVRCLGPAKLRFKRFAEMKIHKIGSTEHGKREIQIKNSLYEQERAHLKHPENH